MNKEICCIAFANEEKKCVLCIFICFYVDLQETKMKELGCVVRRQKKKRRKVLMCFKINYLMLGLR